MIAGKVAVVLQARMGSVRLPGKVLQPLAGATMLAHCIARLQAAAAGPLIVATTTLETDDAVVAEAGRLGVSSFRGDADDVLGRYAAAAAAVGAEFVVRATADNPAVDPLSVSRLLDALRCGFADYAVEEGLPLGCTVEAVRASALEDAARRAIDPSDREHVTPFIRRQRSGFKCLRPGAPAGVRRPDLRFTVDTAADLAYMRRVLAEARASTGRVPSLDALIAAAGRLDAAEEVA